VSEDPIRCGAETLEGGRCRRKLRPGQKCRQHPWIVNKGGDAAPLKAKPCVCSRPVVYWQEDEITCIRCGRTPEPDGRRRKRRPKRPSKALETSAAGESPFLPGEQLRLEV
jgi:hypothetical protein